MCAQNPYWWTTIATFRPCAHEAHALRRGATSLHATIPLTLPGLAQIPSHSLWWAHPAHVPPQLTAGWCDTVMLSGIWQTLLKGRIGLLRIWAPLMWDPGYAQQDSLSFLSPLSPVEGSQLRIKKQEQFLVLQEAMLERENLKCCTFLDTRRRKEMHLSGRFDNMPAVNALKTSTYFPPSES